MKAWSHDAFKSATEDLVAGAFIEHLRREAIDVRTRRRGRPGEPDFICDVGPDATPLGIEVTSGFYSVEHAAQLRKLVEDLARRGRRQTVMSTSGIGDADLPPGVFRGPDASLAAALQTAMESHCLRRYGMRAYLILDASWAPLASTSDASSMLGRLKLPADCRYDAVFLCLTRDHEVGRDFFRLS